MKIQSILEKGSSRINEDALHVGRDLFGVFDGATSLEPRCFDGGTTGGRLAAETACDVFARNGGSLVHLAGKANTGIHDRMVDQGVNLDRREQLWSTSAAVVRIRQTTIEWLQSGDSFVLFLLQDGSYRVPAQVADHDYETLTLWKSMACRSQVNISHALAGQIRKVRMGMNRAYGVLNGEPEAEAFFHTGVFPRETVDTVLLFTDGLSLPSRTPQKVRQFDRLVRAYTTLGLKGVKNHIRAVEARDPHCRKYPRFKCHDDIAAIAVDL